VRHMVVGFLFHGRRVLLVQKTKPVWQEKLWNGVGGKVEPGEGAHVAMQREFLEETTLTARFEHYACEDRPEGDDYCYKIDFFRATLPDHDDRPLVPQFNDAGEALWWVPISSVGGMQYPVVGNLRWLIPLALDPRKLFAPPVVRYTDDIRERPTW